MVTNIGTLDRAIRVILGVALMVSVFYGSLALFDDAIVRYTAIAIGLILAITGVVGTCPAYSIFGFRTCKA